MLYCELSLQVWNLLVKKMQNGQISPLAYEDNNKVRQSDQRGTGVTDWAFKTNIKAIYSLNAGRDAACWCSGRCSVFSFKALISPLSCQSPSCSGSDSVCILTACDRKLSSSSKWTSLECRRKQEQSEALNPRLWPPVFPPDRSS